MEMALYQRLLTYANLTKDDCVTFNIQRYATTQTKTFSKFFAPKRIASYHYVCLSQLTRNFSNSGMHRTTNGCDAMGYELNIAINDILCDMSSVSHPMTQDGYLPQNSAD